MLQNWLEIVPAQGQRVRIEENTTFAQEALRNKIWYRGDAAEIEQYYKQTEQYGYCTGARFWAAVPETESVRKMHSGLPAMIVDTLTYIVKADMEPADFGTDMQAADKWEQIESDFDFRALVGKAIRETLVTGDGAFKISVDTELSDYPIVEFVPGDRVDYIIKRGRLCGVDFWTRCCGEKGQYSLRERYERGHVSYALFDGDKEVPLDRAAECAGLQPAAFDGGYLMAVPFRVYDNPRFCGRGKSVFDSKTDVFDSHDEVISQWMDAIRAGRVQKYIPEDMIPRDPKTGALLTPDTFGSHFVAVGGNVKEGIASKIETIQPEIRYDAFLSTYSATLNMCLQGILSPATLGIDVGKMASGEAQREKKDVTGYTRNAITDALEKTLPALICAVLKTYDNMCGRAPEEYEPSVSFGEYGAPDFDSRINTVAAASGADIMSIESQVDELWGDSKDEQWKSAEVERIKRQRGIEAANEPAVGGDLIDVG